MCKLKSKSNEIAIKKENGFSTKYGSKENIKDNNIFYVRTKTKITPITNKQTYEDDVEKVKFNFANYISKLILKNKHFENEYLSNIDMSAKSISYGKISFLRYDIYLKMKNKDTLENNKELLYKISDNIDTFLIKTLSKHNIQCC